MIATELSEIASADAGPAPGRADGTARPRVADVWVAGLIVACGVLQLFFYSHAADFLHDDVFYADAARSLLHHGVYGIDGHPETNQPPGLPAILAALCLVGACSHAAFLRAMVVFQTIGFVASYALLRRHAPRIIAAAIPLLLISSEVTFSSVTQWVHPYAPYFCTTMCALLAARRLETASSLPARTAWGALLAALCAASIVIATAGIALIGALLVRIGITFFQDRRRAGARLRLFLGPVLVGIAVQGWWMRQTPAPLEWPIAGYPHPYLEQLTLKNGNDPELGIATWRDIGARVARNAFEDSLLVARLLERHWINVSWMSVAITGPLILMVVGWLASVRGNGGELHDWYFAGYEFIYLLWPWNVEARFFLPVAPLACLYVWRGVVAVAWLGKHKPRTLGIAWLPLSVWLTISAWYWMRGSGIARHMLRGGLQGDLSFLIWLLSGLIAAWMAWAGSAWLQWTVPLRGWFVDGLRALHTTRTRVFQLATGAPLIGLVTAGLVHQIVMGRDNLNIHSPLNVPPADVDAGRWIAAHTDSNAVLMARHVPVVYHYSGRKVVWFPPSSNARVLMEGIQRLRVDYVLVVHRTYSYYLPADDDAFAPLLAAYPHAFCLAFRTPDFQVFRVRREQRC